MTIGRRFAKSKNRNWDSETFQAEALFWIVVAAKSGEDFTLKTLKKYIYKNLYEYYFHNLGTIKVNYKSYQRNSKLGRFPVNYDYLTTPIDRNVSNAMLNESLEDILATVTERNYIHLKIDGYDEEQISVILDVNINKVLKTRAHIIGKLKNANLSTFSRFSQVCDDSGQQEVGEATDRSTTNSTTDFGNQGLQGCKEPSSENHVDE